MLATKMIETPDIAAERSAAYRNAMARLAAAVTIVTTDGVGGKAGFAATAVTSVSDNPPTLLVCLNRGSSAFPAVKANGVVTVNVLSNDHQNLSRLFGGKTPVDERFAGADWEKTETGAWRLPDALASFDCRITSIADGATHDVLFCEVIETVVRPDGEALVYFDRDYRVV
ncbi:flavin reductase [Rhizobium sp. FKL33]|uniref:flavin reductase n=1 Tax=Rhizobium sp. FKL33 TaxID=2562307 RepID=UPI0010BFEBC0|nr:flavin reductase [Rhizobium sp. FKL33]